MAQPKVYTEHEINEMSKKLITEAKYIKRNHVSKLRPIRAINYKNEPISLLSWVNRVRTGRLFPYNPLIQRGPPFSPGNRGPRIITEKRKYSGEYSLSGCSNHHLWLEVSSIYESKFAFWIDPTLYKQSGAPRNPRIADLIFRRNEDFRSGVWQKFSSFWIPHIHRLNSESLRDEAYETLFHGADLYSHSRLIKNEKAEEYRRGLSVYTIPVTDPDYVKRKIGRDPNKHDRQPQAVVGYRPVKVGANIKECLEIKTNQRNCQYSHVIYDQLLDWLKSGAIGLAYDIRDQANWRELTQIILPMVVEVTKPRLCIDGSLLTCVAPKEKLPCKLDSITELMKSIKPNQYLSIVDDKSGFLQGTIEKTSRKLCMMKFGHAIFFAVGLLFGLTQSSAKFQLLNSVAKNTMNVNGMTCLLYLDDRCTFHDLPYPLSEGETSRESYCLSLLLVSLGGFVNIKKSNLVPSQKVVFLGLEVDTKQCTLTVPQEKYQKAMDQVNVFLKGEKGHYDIKLLEKIRGKFTSWCAVIPNFRIFIREMNSVIAYAYKHNRFQLSADEFSLIHLQEEISVWQDLKEVQLTRKWYDSSNVEIVINKSDASNCEIYTDSSGSQMGALVTKIDGKLIPHRAEVYRFDQDQILLPIHVKEMLAIVNTLYANCERIRNKRVTL